MSDSAISSRCSSENGQGSQGAAISRPVMPSLSALSRDRPQSAAPSASGVPPSCLSLTMRAWNAAPTALGPGGEHLVEQPRVQRARRDRVDVDMPCGFTSSASVSVKRTTAALEAA